MAKIAGGNRRPRTGVISAPEMRERRVTGVVRHPDNFLMNQISETYRPTTSSLWQRNYHPYISNHVVRLGLVWSEKECQNIRMTTLPIRKLLVLIAILSLSTKAWGVVFNVTTAEEFQAALSVASSNSADDEIRLADGVYFGNFQVSLTDPSELVISGDPNDSSLVELDGQSRAFVLLMNATPGLAAMVRVENLTIRNGESGSFGGCLSFQSDRSFLKLENISFQKCGARTEGASAYIQSESLSIRNMEVFSLKSGESGLYIGAKEASVTNLKIESNLEPAIHVNHFYIDNAVFELSESTILNCVICVQVSGGKDHSVNISKSNFSGVKKSAYNLRGGFSKGSFKFSENTVHYEMGSRSYEKNSLSLYYNSCGSTAYRILIERSMFWLDNANMLYLGECGQGFDLEFSNNLVVGNGETTFSTYHRSARIINNTFLGLNLYLEPNTYSSEGLETLLVNNIFAASQDGSPSSVQLRGYTSNDVFSNNALGVIGAGWDVFENNLDVNPQFFDEEEGDFHLVEGSPLIDAGDSSYFLAIPILDLEGNPRSAGGSIDIGAYERSIAALHPADTDNNSSISQSEFDAYNAAWRINEDWPSEPTRIPVDFVTRAGYLLQKGGAYKNIGVGKPATWVPARED